MKIKRIAIAVCRLLLGASFIFSGFVKGVDPMGTAIKIGEYYSAFGLDFMHGTENLVSICLSTAEMLLGFMVLLGIWLRVSATLMAIGMLFFTIFTLYIALRNPVADCGCFGEAVKLTNWGSFYKNLLVLLPLSIITCTNAWMSPKRKESYWNFFWIAVFIALGSGIGIYALRHLPIIDFLPYKTGVDVPKSIADANADIPETKVACRDTQTGKVEQFLLSDTTWYDTTRWEYVETIVGESKEKFPGRTAASFALFLNGSDATSVLGEGVVFALCITDPRALDDPTFRKLFGAVTQAQQTGYRPIAITPIRVGEHEEFTLNVPYYNIDDVVLKSLLRAKNGLVVFKNGVITDKFNARDIPDPGDFPAY